MVSVLQPTLLDLVPAAQGISPEMRETLWVTLEALCHVEKGIRAEALSVLQSLDDLPASMLVLHQLLMVLRDTQLENRQQALQLVAMQVVRADWDLQSQLAVREACANWLKKASLEDVSLLLECSLERKGLRGDVLRILNLHASVRLALEEIIVLRSKGLGLRQEAVYCIGRLGFVDSIPVLRKLLQRLEARQQGQRSMPFAATEIAEEAGLAPEVRHTISRLEESG